MKLKNFKVAMATAAAVVVMGMTAIAGSKTFPDAFTVYDESWFTVEGKYEFDSKVYPDMTVKMDKGYAAGTGDVCICKKGLFSSYHTLQSDDFPVKKGNYSGVNINLSFGKVSKGTRYFVFGSDETAYYRVKSYTVEW